MGIVLTAVGKPDSAKPMAATICNGLQPLASGNVEIVRRFYFKKEETDVTYIRLDGPRVQR